MHGVIYRLNNYATGGFYIGSALDFGRRKWEHLSLLKKGMHHCKKLQVAYDEHGRDAFDFEVLEEVIDAARLRTIEDVYLFNHGSDPLCYNSLLTTTTPPGYSADVRAKISASLRATYSANGHPRTGTQHSEETRAKISANRKGKMAGARHYRFGKTVSDAVREKIGAAQRGKKKAAGRQLSAEGRERIRAAAEAGHYDHWTGRTHTVEARVKMSKGITAVSPEGDVTAYSSITAFRLASGMKPTTINNALKSGRVLARGPYKGWRFRYV